MNDRDPTIGEQPGGDPCGRTRTIERAVRRALTILSQTERRVIEGYYFDGCSFGRLAAVVDLPQRRVRVIHQRALSRLEFELAPLVEQMFGIRSMRAPNCPVCNAEWRVIAEDLLDEKTEEMTWGDVIIRLERAVGWRAPTPQILISHTRKHRTFTQNSEPEDKENSNECTDSVAWPTCD